MIKIMNDFDDIKMEENGRFKGGRGKIEVG